MRMLAWALVVGMGAGSAAPLAAVGPDQARAGVGERVRERLRQRIEERRGERDEPRPAREPDPDPGSGVGAPEPGSPSLSEADRGPLSDDSFTVGRTKVLVWEPVADKFPRPLVIFSHGYHGVPEQSRFLMRSLSGAGYWVMAPRHADAIGGGGAKMLPEHGLGKPDEWTEADFRDRAEDVRAVLDAVRTRKEWEGRIDLERVALAGHSLGGYTAVGLVGGWSSWKIPGIKAVVALSPYLNPFNQKGTLKDLDVPVMYQTGTLDLGVAPFVSRKGMAFDSTPSPAVLVVFKRAAHFAWTDLNPRFHESISDFTLAFLDRYLRDPPVPTAWPKAKNVAAFKQR